MMSISKQETLSQKLPPITENDGRLDQEKDDFFYLAPVGLLVLGKDGVIQKANPLAAQLVRYPLDQLHYKKLDELINPIDLSSYHFFIYNFTEKRNNETLEIRLKKQDNAIVCLECKASLTKNNNLLLALYDITERRQAEEAIIYHNETLSEKIRNQLLEREAKLNSIFNASIEGIVTIDSKGTIVSVNSAIRTIFGYTEAELVNCNIDKLLPLLKQKRRPQYLKKGYKSLLQHLLAKSKKWRGCIKMAAYCC